MGMKKVLSLALAMMMVMILLASCGANSAPMDYMENSKAEMGYVVESYRVCYVNDVEVERVLLYTDTYKPKPAIVYVGTKKRDK